MITEIHTRRKCDNQECKGGRIPTGNLKFPWEPCGNCNGTGYIYEWVDIKEFHVDNVIH